jgi:hypothetical protein
MTVKSIGSSVSSNVVGAIAGGVILYFVAKKALKVENKFAVAGLAIVGVIAGAMAQSKFASKATLAPAIAKA